MLFHLAWLRLREHTIHLSLMTWDASLQNLYPKTTVNCAPSSTHGDRCCQWSSPESLGIPASGCHWPSKSTTVRHWKWRCQGSLVWSGFLWRNHARCQPGLLTVFIDLCAVLLLFSKALLNTHLVLTIQHCTSAFSLSGWTSLKPWDFSGAAAQWRWNFECFSKCKPSVCLCSGAASASSYSCSSLQYVENAWLLLSFMRCSQHEEARWIQ